MPSLDLPSDAPVAVVGGGLTGIEAASELAQQGRPVTLVCGGILGPSLSKRGRRSVGRRLRRLGVDVLESIAVSEVRWDSVVLSDGAVLPSAATVWTAGFGVPELAARSGLRTDALGRLLTDETLTSIDDERIVAAGDAAAPSGHPLRMSCQAAYPVGGPSRQHRAQPHRRKHARAGQPGVRRSVHQPGPRTRNHPAGAHRRHPGEHHRGRSQRRVRSRKPSARARCGPSGAKPPSPARTTGSRAASAPRSWWPSRRLHSDDAAGR